MPGRRSSEARPFGRARDMSFRQSFAILLFVTLIFVVVPGQAEATVLLRGGMGLSAPSGDIGDDLLRSGGSFKGDVFFGLNETLYLGGSLHIALLGGQRAVYGDQGIDIGRSSVEITEGGALVAFEIGGLAYLANKTNPVRPFIGGTVGRGGLAWRYSWEAEQVFGTDADAVGFWFLAPQAGLSFPLNKNLALAGDTRFVLPRYDDQTSEGYIFNPDGGTFLEAHLIAEIEF